MTPSLNPKSVGDELGQPVDGRRAWRSAGFSGEADNSVELITRLSPDEIRDLVSIAEGLSASGRQWLDLPLQAVTNDRLTTRFGKVANELGNGRGFAIIRGLDALDPEMFRKVFWVIGNYLGKPVMQNARGEVLSEVFDRFSGAPRDIDSRGYESNDELRFHCDGGDCIGLGCVRPAPRGGESGLVSLLAIYNELLAHHPEHMETLYRGFPLYVRKEKEADGTSTRAASISDRRIPVFAARNGQLSSWLNIRLAEHAAEAQGKTMAAGDRAALICLEEIAERPEMKLRFTLRSGDVLWIHNMSVMHRRDLYHDDPDPKKLRIFYRMWTNFHQARDVVPAYAALRQGIRGPTPVIVGPSP